MKLPFVIIGRHRWEKAQTELYLAERVIPELRQKIEELNAALQEERQHWILKKGEKKHGSD